VPIRNPDNDSLRESYVTALTLLFSSFLASLS